MKLKKGMKFMINSTEVTIISASNSGLNTCKVKDCIFKLDYSKILNYIK